MAAESGSGADDAVRAYKTILAAVIDGRPSGTRQRLADRLGKNRSFVTQITSPAYGVPLPARHVPAILSLCRFSRTERDRFLDAYEKAHPGKAPLPPGVRGARQLTVAVPDLGDARRNAAFDRAVAEIVERVAALMDGD